MSFTWPYALALVAVGPLLVLATVLRGRRRRRDAVLVSDVALIRAAVGGRPRWRRWLPLALFVVGLSCLSLAAARPRVAVAVPVSQTSMILALDVSRSMCATDVDPNRLAAAQAAARSFVESKDPGTQIGIVAFSGSAALIVPPTRDADVLAAAIDGLTTSRGTAIGAATLQAVDAIAEINPDVAPMGTDVPPAGGDHGYVPDIVVVLTDGANTRGIDPVAAAEQAAARRVRVFTIGFGTTNPSSMVCTSAQLGANAFEGGGFRDGRGGGGGGGGRRQALVADEPSLMRVADITGGTYAKAENAEQLREVFEDLPSHIELQTEQREVSAVFVLFGVLGALAAVTLSLLWNRFP